MAHRISVVSQKVYWMWEMRCYSQLTWHWLITRCLFTHAKRGVRRMNSFCSPNEVTEKIEHEPGTCYLLLLSSISGTIARAFLLASCLLFLSKHVYIFRQERSNITVHFPPQGSDDEEFILYLSEAFMHDTRLHYPREQSVYPAIVHHANICWNCHSSDRRGLSKRSPSFPASPMFLHESPLPLVLVFLRRRRN